MSSEILITETKMLVYFLRFKVYSEELKFGNSKQYYVKKADVGEFPLLRISFHG